MIEWYKQVVFQNYANFNGRARRSEYWYFYLTNMIVYILLVVLMGIFANISSTLSGLFMLVYVVYALAMIIPGLAVAVRRLHDVDKSGWFLLLSIIPVVGPILLLIWFCTEGTRGTNIYGSDPKGNTIHEIGIE